MNIIKAIISINPNATVSVEDNNVDKITWLNGTTPISKADIEAKMVELQADYDVKQYQRDRAVAYKEIKEQLDLLYHDMVADKGDKTGEWFKHIKDIKDANPKD
tara:strand:- start:44 stop:355 length:312 start_codon:yes stop_codon:yes gene_type:complete